MPLSGGVGFPSGSFWPSGSPFGPTGVSTFPSGPFGFGSGLTTPGFGLGGVGGAGAGGTSACIMVGSIKER